MKKIAIIGAGISGLFFANLLKKNSGYNFTIFEKKSSIDLEDGYGLQLSVNSIKLLNQIGFSTIDKKQIYHPKKINFINAKDNKKICDLDISKFNYDNNQYTTIKRSTLLKFLLKNISTDKIKFNTQLTKLTYGKMLNLYFNESFLEDFDYMIVSDGVFSKTKSIILKRDTKPSYFHSLALRGNIDDYENEDISIYFGPSFHFVIYPLNQNKEFNFISVFKKKLLDKKLYSDEFFLQKMTQELQKNTSLKLANKLINLKSFPIYITKKFEFLENKNIFFVGDALLAIPPSLAQGASQSIESSQELFDQIQNKDHNYYKKRIKKLNSVNWRSKLNYHSFHLSNSMFCLIRNYILKLLVKNNKFLDFYLGKIYRD